MATGDFSVAALAQAMDRATDEVKQDVARLIDVAASNTVNRLQTRYPQGPTGNLRTMVRVTSPRQFSTTSNGVALPAKLVKASAPHVHLWQEGSRERFDATRGNARRGQMPAGGRVFQAVAADERRKMLEQAGRILTQRRELV